MSDPERGSHGHEVLELVPGAFLHLQAQSAVVPPLIRMTDTDLEPTRSVGLHHLAHVADKLGDGRPHLAMLDHERLGYALRRAWC